MGESDQAICAWLQSGKLTAKSFAVHLPKLTAIIREGTLPADEAANRIVRASPLCGTLSADAEDAEKVLNKAEQVDADVCQGMTENLQELQRIQNTVLSIARELCVGSVWRSCWNCERSDAIVEEGTLQKCSGCSTAMYCSRKCQQDHWKAHKQQCKVLKAEKSSVLKAAKVINPAGNTCLENFASGRNTVFTFKVKVWCQHCHFASIDKLNERIDLIRAGSWWLYEDVPDRKALFLDPGWAEGQIGKEIPTTQEEAEKAAVPLNHVASIVVFLAGTGDVAPTRAAYEYIWGEAMLTKGRELSSQEFYMMFSAFTVGTGQGNMGRANIEVEQQWCRVMSSAVTHRIEQLQDLGSRATLLGPRVSLAGIQAQPELNGQTGGALGADGDRLMVRLDSGRELKVREEKVQWLAA